MTKPVNQEQFKNQLLALGGKEARVHDDDALPEIASQGKVMKPSNNVKLIHGYDSECHSNVCRLHFGGYGYGNREDVIPADPSIRVHTGYALDDDENAWRRHSWGVQGDQIIETTSPRKMYFGMELTGERLQKFKDQEDPRSGW